MASPSAPHLFVLGASHQNTPIELREKLALPGEKLDRFAESLRQVGGLHEFAILNTCNRVEFYGVADGAAPLSRLEEQFCSFQGFPPERFGSIRQLATGRDAIEHLLAVSSGLESQMLGETEILGQVKSAYALAQEKRTVGPTLNRVFQKCFQYAKYVRTHTAITEGQISVANVAVDLAQKIFGELTATRALLLGAGDIGEKTLKAFQSRGAPSLTVASRTLERAMELGQTFGAAALPFEQVPARLGEFDVVVCSTASPDAVVTAAQVAVEMKRRRAQPLFFIDLALPRDVEPEVAQIENVFVYNLDDLAKIADENRAAREAEVVKARAILREKSSSLWQAVSKSG